MTDDLKEELELFLEDMGDQLALMESTLLDISEVPLEEIDKEMINVLFRAMHTMKGNAGLFGYDIIIDFSHKAENILDLIRNDQMSLSEELLELFLHIKDHSKILVEICTQEIELEGVNKEEYDSLMFALDKHLLNQKQNKEPKQVISVKENEEYKKTLKYRIDISLKSQFFESGMDMVSILKYLSVIGSITSLKLIDDEIPLLKDISPKKAYVKFTIEYESDEERSEIQDAFEFVEEDIDLHIELCNKNENRLKNENKMDEEFRDFVINNNTEIQEKTEEKIQEKNEVQIQDTFKEEIEVKEKTSERKKVIANDVNTSLRVDSSKIDKIINQISEMVIANAKITQYAINSKNSEFEESVSIMSEMLEEIRDGVMNIRMVQVAESFSKYRRVVNDTAKKLGKDISFEIIGGETGLDKTVIEKISDPLVHMLRNAMDHGIETKEIREAQGKNPKGSIILKAYPDAGSIVIQIIDDGAGIDKDLIYKKAIERNLIQKNAHLNEKEIYNLLFQPGFSTAKELTGLSGRGVGMDVVKKNITQLRGSVNIKSTLKKGTTVTIRLPLTLAIIDGFLVKVGNSKYIIPLSSIQECIEFTKYSKEQFSQNGYISLRKNVLPILDLIEHFNEEKVETKRENIVIVKHGTSSVGLKVDELFGEFQTVIKPLGPLFENIADISGGTILGNGEIALIFDVEKLIEHKISYEEV